MLLALASVGAASLFVALLAWSYPQRVSPDGRFYLLMGAGQRVPAPYCYRFLVPMILRDKPAAWTLASGLGLIASAGLLAFYLQMLGHNVWEVGLGVVLLCGLPGIFKIGVQLPVLTDQIGLAFGLGSAIACLYGYVLVGVGIALLGAMVRETVPVWAAIYSWSPWPLIGLAVLVLAVLAIRPGTAGADEKRVFDLAHPFQRARAAHRGQLLDPLVMVAPWGMVLLLIIGDPTLQLGAALAFGYGQLFGATDSARLYQQAAPVAIAAACTVAPLWLLVPIGLAHVFNPWRGEGV